MFLMEGKMMAGMIEHKLAQQIVETVKNVCGQDINFIDDMGIIFASTDEKRIGSYHEIGHQVAQTGSSIEVNEDDAFSGTKKGINIPIYHNQELLAVIGITGEPENVRKYAHLAERITNLLIREREIEAFSRTQAEKKHYVIDSLVRGEISNRNYLNALLNEFGGEMNTEKRLVMIRINPRCNPVNSTMFAPAVQQFFSILSINLYCFYYPDEYLAVISKDNFEKEEYMIKAFAKKQMGILKIAVGKADLIYNLSVSYETAKIAWKSIADTDSNYILFDALTFELLLSSMNKTTREEYLRKTIMCLSEKEIKILDTYFDTECSLAEASKKLFIHKNTLQYQLNHIFDLCGLNPRKFQDAVLLYIAIKIAKRFP